MTEDALLEQPADWAARSSARPAEGPAAAADWGEGLAYPEWMRQLTPLLHDRFTYLAFRLLRGRGRRKV